MPVILVTEVAPNVMSTIDTGRPRSLADTLKLHNFQYSNNVAALIKRIIGWQKNNTINRPGEYANTVTNIIGEQYALQNRYNLHSIVSEAAKIYNKSTTKVIPITTIAFYMWLLNGYSLNDDIRNFMAALTGQSTGDDSAASWIYKKLYQYKQDRVTPSPKWVLAMVIKAWNSFVNGNPAVGYMKFDITDELPRIAGRDVTDF
jgi:hypothetical protein